MACSESFPAGGMGILALPRIAITIIGRGRVKSLIPITLKMAGAVYPTLDCFAKAHFDCWLILLELSQRPNQNHALT